MKLSSFLQNICLKTVYNLIPGIAPDGVPQPGQSGGGILPSLNLTAAALAPPGTIPIAVFPPFASPRTFPALCVIYSELTAKEQGFSKKKYNQRRQFNYLQRKKEVQLKKKIDFPVFRKIISMKRKFGFTCKVRLVEERCQLGVTCNSSGQKIFAESLLRRQTGEEFRCAFHQYFMCSFYALRFQKRIMVLTTYVNFYAFGICVCKNFA